MLSTIASLLQLVEQQRHTHTDSSKHQLVLIIPVGMKDACVVNALVAQVRTNWRSTQSPGSTLPLITQALADPRPKYNTVFIELESQCVILLFFLTVTFYRGSSGSGG